MPTLKERIETLEAALRDQRDPLTQAAKADHTPSKRILELESQHADLAAKHATLQSEHAATQKLIIQHNSLISELENKVQGLLNRALDSNRIITGVQPDA